MSTPTEPGWYPYKDNYMLRKTFLRVIDTDAGLSVSACSDLGEFNPVRVEFYYGEWGPRVDPPEGWD